MAAPTLHQRTYEKGLVEVADAYREFDPTVEMASRTELFTQMARLAAP